VDQVKVFPARAALVEAVAGDIAACAQEAIDQRGRFSIALCGGSTPGPLFDHLASHAFRDRIVWGSVHVFWGDDRAVPPDHEDSNYRLAKERLLDHVPIPPAQIHRMRTELAPELAADHYERLLREFFAEGAPGEPQPRFDYLLQGMGPDGHTASLFPHTEALAITDPDRWVVANYVPQLDTWRITLTAPAINAGRNVIFMVEGAGKAERLREVLKGDYRPDVLPSQLIAPMDGRLVWMVDEAAAARL
jgi:6-phosphogluconolactonase